MSNLTTKCCKKCGNEYPLTGEFWHKNKSSKSGYYTYCKKCNRQHANNYRNKHINEVREKDRIRSKNVHPDKKRQRYLDWLDRNPGRQQELSRLYHAANAERIRAHVSQWKKDNPEKVRAQWHNRRCRELGIPGNYTENEIGLLYDEQCGLCFHCSADLCVTGFERDHWIPITKPQSTNWISNIRLLCPSCNSRKHNKLPWLWCPEKYEKPEDYPDCQ